jgi:hypothetical protein
MFCTSDEYAGKSERSQVAADFGHLVLSTPSRMSTTWIARCAATNCSELVSFDPEVEV